MLTILDVTRGYHLNITQVVVANKEMYGHQLGELALRPWE